MKLKLLFFIAGLNFVIIFVAGSSCSPYEGDPREIKTGANIRACE